MKKPFKLILVGAGLIILVLIRLYEDSLFYDPLLTFFKTDHTTMPLPALETGKLFVHLMFRFLLNSLVSLGIIWVAFQSREVVSFSALLYGIFAVVLGITFYLLLDISEAGDHMVLFYVRRFLIQPILLFLLLPAFYVQRIQRKRI